MDKILTNKYIGKLSEEFEKGFYNLVLTSSDKQIERNNKINYIYSPNDDLELILETNKDSNKLNITNFDLNIKSDSIWKMRILKSMNIMEHSYIVNNIEGTGTYAIRVVNQNCLNDEIKEGDELVAKVAGFVLNANIYKDEEEFKKSLPKAKVGEKSMTNDGSLMPIHLINNHGSNLNKDNKYKIDDLLVTLKGTLKNIRKVDLEMNGNKFLPYFKADIDTAFGRLPIIFNARTLLGDVKGFNPGFIIVAEVLLSADVCINEYEKYKSDSDYLKVINEFMDKDNKKKN